MNSLCSDHIAHLPNSSQHKKRKGHCRKVKSFNCCIPQQGHFEIKCKHCGRWYKISSSRLELRICNQCLGNLSFNLCCVNNGEQDCLPPIYKPTKAELRLIELEKAYVELEEKYRHALDANVGLRVNVDRRMVEDRIAKEEAEDEARRPITRSGDCRVSFALVAAALGENL